MITAIEIDRETGQIMNVERAEVRDADFRRIVEAIMCRQESREESA